MSDRRKVERKLTWAVINFLIYLCFAIGCRSPYIGWPSLFIAIGYVGAALDAAFDSHPRTTRT